MALMSFSDGLHYTWLLTGVCLAHSDVAPSKAVSTPSVLNQVVHTFPRLLKAMTSVIVYIQ